MIRAAFLACALAVPAAAHDGVAHGSDEEAAAHLAASAPIDAGLPFFADIGGAFALTDQNGVRRTQADPDGRMQLLFFGYANCQAICSVALPLMGQVASDLEARGLAVTPVMVTVDPARDTVEAIGAPLAQHHPRFVGLTGTEADLAVAWDAFRVEHEVVFEDPEYGPIFAHGSHVYLLDAGGEVLTLLPPILSEARVAEIVRAYAAE